MELGIELRGDLTVEEENFLRSQIDERMEKTKNLQKYVGCSMVYGVWCMVYGILYTVYDVWVVCMCYNQPHQLSTNPLRPKTISGLPKRA
ncbi:hypothetical protein EON65_38195 [archaeon]|nr:MAG: hypothetical protein EON65_38195 [archaeon]